MIETIFRVGVPLIAFTGLAAFALAMIHASIREGGIRRGRMLAVTGPLVDEESATTNAARKVIWEQKAAGKWPTYRVRR